LPIIGDQRHFGEHGTSRSPYDLRMCLYLDNRDRSDEVRRDAHREQVRPLRLSGD